MTSTKIEWVRGEDGSAGMSWNALRAWISVTRKGQTVEVSANHCERVNEACRFCYAERQNFRLGGVGFKPGNRHLYRFAVDPEKLLEPVRRRKPTRIFVESMSDAYGEWWPTEYIDQLYAVMAICQQHTFINLSKRPARRRDYLADPTMPVRVAKIAHGINASLSHRNDLTILERLPSLRNVIEGVSVSCQEDADEFVPALLGTRCHRRAVSAEPLLGPIDFLRYLNPVLVSDLHWIITGGESGDKARPFHPDWERSILGQCETAGIAHYFKQWGEWCPPPPGIEYNTIHGRKGTPPAFLVAMDGTVHCVTETAGPNPATMVRLGKKAAGRLFDGVEHNGFPTL